MIQRQWGVEDELDLDVLEFAPPGEVAGPRFQAGDARHGASIEMFDAPGGRHGPTSQYRFSFDFKSLRGRCCSTRRRAVR